VTAGLDQAALQLSGEREAIGFGLDRSTIGEWREFQCTRFQR
jgi:hypothetical protein